MSGESWGPTDVLCWGGGRFEAGVLSVEEEVRNDACGGLEPRPSDASGCAEGKIL